MAYSLERIVKDGADVPVSGAQVYVYDSNGLLAPLVTELDVAAPNPAVSDSLGYAAIFVADVGTYTLSYYWGGRERKIETAILTGGSVSELPASVDGTLAGNSDVVVPTQKAVKTYVDGPRFAQSGTGAVARTVPDKLRDLHSIRDFGGVGGGVINDSGADAAMRAAVKAAGGGVMVYPAISGGYKIGTRARSPGILIEEADFPAFFGEEPPGQLRVYTRNNGAGGTGESGITSFMVNGTGNMVPFSTIGGTDSVALSAVVYSGEDAPNPICAVNIISRYAGLPPGINWGIEIDMNNESPTSYSAGDPRGGQGIVLNTGSTYSPDTGIVIQRGTGEGTGPGWKQGIGIKGARDVGILVQAMSSSTAPGMSPAATGTIAALVVNVGGDAFNRFVLTESGQMFWSSGSSSEDVNLGRGGAGALNCSGVFGATQYWVGANAVVGSRRTGWTAPTGTLSRATFDEATVTLPQLAQRVAALITDLHGQAGGHGIIGN